MLPMRVDFTVNSRGNTTSTARPAQNRKKVLGNALGMRKVTQNMENMEIAKIVLENTLGMRM